MATWQVDRDKNAGLSTEKRTINAKLAYEYFHDTCGFSTASTCAIIGNMEHESYLNPACVNSIGAKGLIQWYKGTELTDYVRDVIGTTVWWSGGVQCLVLRREIMGERAGYFYPETKYGDECNYQYNGEQFKAVTDLLLATRIFYYNRERAGKTFNTARYTLAKKWYDYFGGDSSTDGSGTDRHDDDSPDTTVVTQHHLPIWLYTRRRY